MLKLSGSSVAVACLRGARVDTDCDCDRCCRRDDAEIACEGESEEGATAIAARAAFDRVEGGAGVEVAATIREGFIEMTESEVCATASVAAL